MKAMRHSFYAFRKVHFFVYAIRKVFISLYKKRKEKKRKEKTGTIQTAYVVVHFRVLDWVYINVYITHIFMIFFLL